MEFYFLGALGAPADKRRPVFVYVYPAVDFTAFKMYPDKFFIVFVFLYIIHFSVR